jgi:protein gp37
MNNTKIEWCDKTLNPVVGCTFNCPYCYARKLNDRFNFVKDFNKPEFFPKRLKELSYKKPQNIFMNSMSDIADWGLSIWDKVFEFSEFYPQHNYLFLTKRPQTLIKRFDTCVRENYWFGVTITENLELIRATHLKNINVKKRFISFEPLLNKVELQEYDYKDFNWFIIGAETGNRQDKIIPEKEWIKSIVGYAQFYSIPVFMKDSLVSIMGEENMLRQFPKELMHEVI